MVFEGGILGGTRKIWGNLYLNSTSILFDNNNNDNNNKHYTLLCFTEQKQPQNQIH